MNITIVITIAKQKTLKFPDFSLTKPENLALKLVKQQQLEFCQKPVKPVIIPDYKQGVRVNSRVLNRVQTYIYHFCSFFLRPTSIIYI